MAIFKLQKNGDDISNAELIEASKTDIDLELHLENWLEKSPWAIAQEPLIWIGRQTTAACEDTTIFPDLLGIDKDGKIVVVELKRGRAPREVVAQLLEYAAWIDELSDEAIYQLAEDYFSKNPDLYGKQLKDIFFETFELDDMPSLNQMQRLFIVAEDIPPPISRVCRFLRMSHGVDVNCLKFSIYKTESNEILVNSEIIVGQEEVVAPKKSLSNRWTGEKPVKQVVWEAVQEVTKNDKNHIFSPKDVSEVILKKYPSFKKNTVGCQIISDCVGHTSRHHYPGGDDRYWWVEKGKYRLFDPERDRIEQK